MSAFQFPDPASQQSVTNPSTGSTYEWKADPGKWVLVSSTGEMPDIPEQVTYQIQTDKILRASQPAIELVDSAGFYSNVKFTGTGGVEVTSDMNGIIIDGSSLATDINLDSYYTKTETDALDTAIQDQVTANTSQVSILKTSKVTQYKYKLMGTEAEALGTRDGDFYVNSTDAKLITLMSLAGNDSRGVPTKPVRMGDIIEFNYNNAVVRYIANSNDTNVLMVTYVSGSRSMIKNDSLYITIYPQNINPITTESIQSQIADTGNTLTLSLITGLKLAVTTAVDFQDLREKILLKLSEIEITATLES